jgi:hypothetical protein
MLQHYFRKKLTQAPASRFCIVTAVWGNRFVDLFLRYALPSLLAEGNIPSASRDGDGLYVIVTTKESAAHIRRSDVVQRLRDHIAVEIIAQDIPAGNPHLLHVAAWKLATRRAARERRHVIFGAADMVWGDGSFTEMLNPLRRGKSAAFLLGHRVTSETTIPLIDAYRNNESLALSIPRRKLADITVRNLAPLAASYLRDSRRMPAHIEHVYYPIPKEGLTFQSTTTHVWAFDPSRIEVTDMWTPKTVGNRDELEFLSDSDRFIAVSLTPLFHQVSWFYDTRQFDLLFEGAVAAHFFGGHVDYMWRVPFLLHTGARTSALWRRQERLALIERGNAYALATAIRVIRALNEHGLRAAASICAAAISCRRATKRLPLDKPFVLLVPSNEAIRRERVHDLLRIGREKELWSAILNHVIIGEPPSNGATTFNTVGGRQVLLSSKRGALFVNSIPVRRNVCRIHDGRLRAEIYEIEELVG